MLIYDISQEKVRREDQVVIEHNYDDEGEIINHEDGEGDEEEEDTAREQEDADDDEKGNVVVEEDSTHSRNDLILSHGSHSVEGLVTMTKTIDHHHKLGLFAIFDGHYGKDVAEYLQGHLFDNILRQDDFFENPETAMRRAYKETDAEILENVVGSRGGSTSVTAIIIPEKKQLIVSHIGDSRAVVCRNGEGSAITHDHTPEKEKDLVESKGGFVLKKPGNVPQVDGQLAMSRAFGDAKVKDHISAKPDVFIGKVDEDIEYLILASDGLWKVMSNQDAVECIKGMKKGDAAAKTLVEEAVERGSKDDISCVVLVF
ncbi:protein phosphatase [Lithospermum erythrorhizon]|uniref:protein-serine/threonine phosphatase n=1 Tax=Lithospermum erythrorhizon TaxID=34254 RepID=A0AAV3QDI1_LITER